MKPIFILLVLSSPALFSCNPEPLQSEQQDPKMLNLSEQAKKKKKLTKTTTKVVKSEPAPAPSPPPKEEAVQVDEVAFYLKVANVQAALSVEDIQRLRRVAKQTGKMSPLSRATLLIGSFRCLLHVGVEASLIEKAITFERTPEGGADWSKLTTVEKLSHDMNISLKDELATNLFAQTLVVYELVLQGIEHGADSPAYIQSLAPVLNDKAVQWVHVQERIAALSKPAQPATLAASPAPEAVPIPNGGLSTQTGSPMAALTPVPQVADDPIKRAQDLSDKNKFEESVALLRSIDKDSAYSAAAQGKIKEVANRAVSELRTKAARAYQSAVPVTDLKARGAYLEDAKKFLTLAIQRYPESDQIDTVKQNLDMINKSLQVINGR